MVLPSVQPSGSLWSKLAAMAGMTVLVIGMALAFDHLAKVVFPRVGIWQDGSPLRLALANGAAVCSAFGLILLLIGPHALPKVKQD